MKKHPVLDTIAKRSPHMSWLPDRTVLLVRHGSHAYGTNVPTSDEDFKGIAIPTREYFLGSSHRFEQAELKTPDPDAVIYDIRKFFTLAMDCNPNIIEVLHTSPEDHLLVDPIGQVILDHKNDFLSKKIKHTFMGYSVSQLKRIKTHKKWIMNPPKSPPTRADLGLPEQTLIPQDQLMAATAEIQKELDRFQFDFMETLDEPTKIAVQGAMSQMLAELKITAEDHWMAAARKIGLSDNFIEIMQKERQYTGAKREWDQYQNWKKTRNVARAALEEKYGYDTKHAYHLVRLIRMCRETLTTGIVTVKRPDREELLSIRNGAWSYDKLIEFADSEEIALTELYKTSTALPKACGKEKLDKLCIQLVERSLSKYSWYSIKKQLNKQLDKLRLRDESYLKKELDIAKEKLAIAKDELRWRHELDISSLEHSKELEKQKIELLEKIKNHT
ncbi:MAG TPA: nucleotidyltransferase domain-containing protein [Candidatus Saccharimonadales bacterium]